MGKKVNELDALTDSTVASNVQLLPVCDPGTGITGKATVAQVKNAVSAYRWKYVALGTEGTSWSMSTLTGKELLMVTRESGILYDTTSAPDSTEYTWDGTSFGVHSAPMAGERFSFIYKSPS